MMRTKEDLDWAAAIVGDEIEPLQYVVVNPLDLKDPVRNALVRPRQDKVRERGLWATRLGPELSGKGHGQVKLALLNEILGGVPLGPIIFGCQAPDTGNAEILAHCGSDEHKARWLRPLLDGEVFSCFSMTEPADGLFPPSDLPAKRDEAMARFADVHAEHGSSVQPQ
jgi:acyl-CoA dehydrogenase